MNKIFIFLLGAGAGSAVTYYLIKEKFKGIANEEIESVVRTFKEKLQQIEDRNNKQEEQKPDEKENYEQKINNLEYSEPIKKEEIDNGVDLSENNDSHIENVDITNDKDKYIPYIITEDEFGDIGNEEETLILYADDVLADEQDQIITDPESLLGNCLTDFDIADDCIYVRNEARETDYVILRSDETFSDIKLDGDN